ncbi:pilus assembly protein CpaF [Acetitomaculum ruminis DSM 5522]|uniref:Pilus assembly protein CpaF n=1 Tax=Acetitomaculum ruminis DSM 5522 TaxID=1120918 RepID=A0A1I0XQT2_9FIRM|nr:ATPase, T2SS/T4P/T4SS family [Acetitomaculum ruminis]SFB02650.1 pilus assembly protein CpaF [Acetitomaculum ruminis DSM 5522]
MQGISQENFGVLYPFIEDELITDIDFNGESLWVTDLEKGRYKVENISITKEFVERFTHIVANMVNKAFNKANNLLEAEVSNLRISIIHESVAVSGRSICIRKLSPRIRNSYKSLLENDFCQKDTLNLLINCVRARMNLIFTGEPGAGKTECARFFSRYISDKERVITIEDSPEFHYKQINKGKDCVELMVDEKDFTYEKAIKTSLRQNPSWIMLSEARSTEVKYLLESFSTGVCGFTTIHTDDVRKIPDRISNMMPTQTDKDRLENDIYEFVNVGVLIRRKTNYDGKIIRKLEQLCFFTREKGKNKVIMFVEDGKIVNRMIPLEIMKKFTRAGIKDPFEQGVAL